MQTGWRLPPAAGSRRRGFTLTELLVVVAIIAILIALVVPTVGVVRYQAKAAATKALLASIDTGLETYKADAKIGGGYPPSFSDDEQNPRGEVVNPYLPNNATNQMTITGAGLLVWALVGADLLGPPGFKPFAGGTLWSQSTGSAGNHAYALSTDPNRPGQPVNARYGPYIDLSRVKLTPGDGNQSSPGFVVPLERELGTVRSRPYPCFLDNFGQPVLYWRADPAGRVLAAQDRTKAPRGIYSHEDNAALLTAGSPQELKLSAAGEGHRLDWDTSWNPTKVPAERTFQGYIHNAQVTARIEPTRADSYLIVTAGQDGVYGSADDIANFDHQGK